MNFRRAWRGIWPAIFFLVATGLIVLSLVHRTSPLHWTWSYSHLRWLSGALGILVFGAFVAGLDLRHRRAARQSSPEQTGGVEGDPDPQWLFARQLAGVRQTDNIAAIPSLIRMIIDPAHHRTRTVESISLQGRVIEQEVSLEFTLPPRRSTTGAAAPTRAEEVYVPALLTRKQELIDGLTISDAQGQSLNTLCYDETIELISVALHFMIFSCIVETTPTGEIVPHGRSERDLSWAELLLLQLIYGGKPRTPEAVNEQIGRAFRILRLPDRPAAETERVRWLREFVTTLSQAYPVVLVLPYDGATGRLAISYRRTMIPVLQPEWPRGRLRLALGLRPFKVEVDTALARKSRSYHLQVNGPTTQYLMEQTVRCQVCGGDLTRAGVRPAAPAHLPGHVHADYSAAAVKPYFKLRSKRGQSYAHLYMRGFAAAKGDNLVLSASFGETPPGTLASATITAALACLLIGAIGHAEATGITSDSDVPPLLLALPTLAASWFGFGSDGEAMLRSSLAGRCSLLITGFNSLSAAIVFLVTNRPGERPPPAMPLTVFGMHFPSWWAVLFLIAGANVLYVFTQLAIRSWSYRRLLLRRETDGAHNVSRTFI